MYQYWLINDKECDPQMQGVDKRETGAVGKDMAALHLLLRLFGPRSFHFSSQSVKSNGLSG